ncbi:glycosyltransferase [Bacillus sp. JJ1521]|uniref:glycosyltransferase n=1 Tax=Bacillus sp. JJ1521 TaxID=3122957 RepID=UPI002FFDD6BE
MKILLVSNMYPDDQNPSYGIFVKKTEDFLINGSHDVTKIVIYKKNSKIKKLFAYIKHYLMVLFYFVFKSNDIIYVHYASHNALPIILGKTLKKNSVIYVNVHGSDVVPETNYKKKMQFLVKRLLYISEKIIVPSGYFKKVVQDKYNLESTKIFISPSGGISEKIFQPRAVHFSNFGLSPSMKYIGYVGRIDKGKGWDDFLKAINILVKENKIGNMRFVLVGNGKYYPEVVDYINKNNIGDYLHLYDLLPHDKLSEIYNLLEVLVFPTRRYESLGLVGIEAMACKCPVIGTNIGALPEYVINNENGILFEPGDYKALAECIEHFFDMSDEQRNQMKMNAYLTSMEYFNGKVMGDFLEFFEKGYIHEKRKTN